MTLDIRIRHILVQVSFNRRQVELVNCNVCLFRMTSVEDMEGVLNTNFQPKTDMPCFSEINAKYKHLTCRLCLCSSGSSGTLCDIHGSMVRKGCTVASAICDLLRLEVSSTDCYPQLVCLECLKKLSEFQSFKDTCLQAKINFDMGLQSNAVLIHPIDQEGKYGTQSPDITTNIPGNYELKDTDDQHFILPSDGMVIENNFTSEIEIKEEFIENSDLRDPLSPGPEHNNMEQALEENDPLKTDESEDCSLHLETEDRDYESEGGSITNPSSPNFSGPKEVLIDENSQGSSKQDNSKEAQVFNTNVLKNIKAAFARVTQPETLDEISLAPVTSVYWKCNDCHLRFPDQRYLLNHCRGKHGIKENLYRPKNVLIDENSKGNSKQYNSKSVKVSKTNESKNDQDASSDETHPKSLNDKSVAPVTRTYWKCDACNHCFLERRYLLNHYRINHSVKVNLHRPIDLIIDENSQGSSKQGNSNAVHYEDLNEKSPAPLTETWWKCQACSQCFKERRYLLNHYRMKHAKELFYRPKNVLIDENPQGNREQDTSKAVQVFNTNESKNDKDASSGEIHSERLNEKSLAPVTGAIWKCDACDQCFRVLNDLRDHYKLKHDLKEPFQCNCCCQLFYKKESLEDHKKIQGHDLPFKCKYCNSSFPYEKILENHLLTHFSNFKTLNHKSSSQIIITNHHHKCEWCDLKFSSEYSLSKHAKVHDGAPFKCDTCELQFNQKKLLSKHFLQKHAEKRYPCDRCRRKFHTEKRLEKHKSVHNRLQFYECKICRRNLLSKTVYEKHMKSHSVDVPFVCDGCGKEFNFKRKLNHHFQAVHMKKNVSCSVCNKTFSSAQGLNLHKTVHTKERNHVCEVCGKAFRQSAGLREHRRTHTGEKPFCCVACNRRFTQKHNLNTHVKMHCKKSSDH